ncbi:hypothetical protein [Burkholderia singularis]|uniref:Uncharacterized protein n=1 Tax=Burkholderia singularis TaxID=1503053 RepID=A0A238H775_9BURK|nr:hypothetical protein [Burkholderia singularis]SMG01050.1 hypothetical protein BSIN_4036 [Burkholderia singularis]
METRRSGMPSDDHDAKNFAMAAAALSTLDILFKVLTPEQNAQLHAMLTPHFEQQTAIFLASGLPDAGVRRYREVADQLLNGTAAHSGQNLGT